MSGDLAAATAGREPRRAWIEIVEYSLGAISSKRPERQMDDVICTWI